MEIKLTGTKNSSTVLGILLPVCRPLQSSMYCTILYTTCVYESLVRQFSIICNPFVL